MSVCVCVYVRIRVNWRGGTVLEEILQVFVRNMEHYRGGMVFFFIV